MKKSAQVLQVMRKNVRAVGIGDNLREAKNSFSQSQCRHLPVMHGGRLLGMLHSSDIPNGSSQVSSVDVPQYLKRNMERMGINQFMKPLPATVSPTDSLDQVAKLLRDDEVSALPVVEDGKLVGIITVSDIIEYLLTNN